MERQSETSRSAPRRTTDSAAWLLVPVLAGPLLLANAAAETAGLANVVRSLADSMILIIPFMALMAAVSPRVSARRMALAAGAFLILDTIGLRGLLFEATRGVIHDSDNPSWVSVAFVLAGCLAISVAAALKPTLCRIVFAVASCAQVVVLLLFHQLLVVAPIGVERDTERHLVEGMVATAGTPTALCGVDGRICRMGTAPELSAFAQANVPHPEALLRLLEETADREALLYTWTEMILPSTDDEGLRHLSVFKQTDTTLLMMSEASPTRVLSASKLAFGVLASLFHQTWMTICVLIVWRHRDLAWTRKGWRPVT